MVQLFQSVHKRKSAVLCGLSGSGKTQLSREYISRESEKHSAIIWIDAATNQTVDQSFAQCAERILLRSHHIPQNAFRVSSQSLVLEWLKRLVSRNWLIIIDGMDNPMVAKSLLQSLNDLLSGHGTICITSTNPAIAKEYGLEQILVAHLDIGSARSLLLWRALKNTTSHDETSKYLLTCSQQSLYYTKAETLSGKMGKRCSKNPQSLRLGSRTGRHSDS